MNQKNQQPKSTMKNMFKRIQTGTLILLGFGVFAVISLSGCATADDPNAGKIGPDYDSTLSNSIRMQEAQSRAIR